MSKTARRAPSSAAARLSRACSHRWSVPGLCLLAGLVFLGIGLAQHDLGLGIAGLIVMLVYGLVLMAFRTRSETIGLLGSGDHVDERRASIQVKASAMTGQVLSAVLAGGALAAIALDSDYTTILCGLCLLGGATYVVSTAVYARRG